MLSVQCMYALKNSAPPLKETIPETQFKRALMPLSNTHTLVHILTETANEMLQSHSWVRNDYKKHYE